MLRDAISFDGFATADLPAIFTSISGPPSIVAGAGPHGQNVLSLGNGHTATMTYDAQGTWTLHGRFRWSIAWAGDLIRLLDAGTTQFALAVNSDGTLSAKRGSTVLATSATSLPTGAFAHVQAKATIHNTAGAYEVRVNGVTVLGPTTGANTRSSANNSANQAQVTTSGGANTLYACDLVYLDGQASDGLYDFLGDKRVYSFAPSAAGTYSAWSRTGGTSTVDALTSADGDTSYLSDATAGDRFSVTPASMPMALAGIKGVGVYNYLRKDDAGSRTARAMLRIGSTNYDSSDISVTDSYLVQRRYWAQNPATSSDFDRAAAQAAEFGCLLQA